MHPDPPFQTAEVAVKFRGFPDHALRRLLAIRQLIFETADETPGVGTVVETLKWGQPAYLTVKPKSGSTIRLGLSKRGATAIFAHCQTTIISDFQTLFPNDFVYQANRAVHLPEDTGLPADQLRLLIRSALTYHLPK